MKKYSKVFIFYISFMVVAAVAWAAGEQKVTFKKGPDGKGAKAEAVIKDEPAAGAEQKHITIKASGLKPNSVYTVWFVNEKPKMDMAGVGTGDYSFRSDSRGNGTYTATVLASDLEKWSLLELARHPDGNPTNMDNIKIALKADIGKLG
jgi:hypothetical protein